MCPCPGAHQVYSHKQCQKNKIQEKSQEKSKKNPKKTAKQLSTFAFKLSVWSLSCHCCINFSMQLSARAVYSSFEWSHHRISFTDSKVRTTLHVSRQTQTRIMNPIRGRGGEGRGLPYKGVVNGELRLCK